MAVEHAEQHLTAEEEIVRLEKENEELRGKYETVLKKNETLLKENKELKKEKELAKDLSLIDPLTNTLNRRGLEEMAKTIFPPQINSERKDGNLEERRKEEKRAKRIAVLMVDIDEFKIFNDASDEGHPGGDHVIQQAAEFLKKSVRGGDIVARWGGDEFVIIFSHPVEKHVINKFFDKKKGRARLEFIAKLDGANIRITFSGGLATLEQGETIKNLNDVIARADKALRKSKEEGRDRITIDASK